MDKKQELDVLRQSNQQQMRNLQTQGLALDGSTVTMVRLNTFIKVITDYLDLSEEDCLAFEYLFETTIAEILQAGAQQLTRARLLSPMTAPSAPPAGGLITPHGRPA